MLKVIVATIFLLELILFHKLMFFYRDLYLLILPLIFVAIDISLIFMLDIISDKKHDGVTLNIKSKQK